MLEATQGDLRWLGLSQSERKERLDFISIRTKRTFSFFLNQIVKDFSDLSQSELKELSDTLFQSELKELIEISIWFLGDGLGGES